MLPEHFVINIADAECSVASWDATSSQFVLKIEKDIGPESGVLVFSGVSFVNMPPEFIVAFVASSRQQVPDFPGVSPEDDEFLFLFQEAWGRVFYVLAERADYSITA